MPAVAEDNAAPVAPVDAPAASQPAEPAAPAVAPAEAPAPAAPSTAPAVPEQPKVVVTPVTPPAPAPEPAPAPALAPAVQPDTDIFRRTPKLDGVIEDGEWDTFYTYSFSGLEVTTYANWDAGSLYIAAKANKPFDMLGVLDARADGWYNGDDNYEVLAVRDGESIKATVNRYDSKRTRTPASAPVSAEEAALVSVVSGSDAAGSRCIEMRIPASLIPKFRTADDRKIGLLLSAKTATEDNGWILSGSPGDTRECTLVSKKFAALKPLNLGFDLLDATVTRGEEIVAKFHLTNGGADTLNIHSFVLAGEGKCSDYLSSAKVRIEGLPSRKHMSHEIRSVIPKDMPLGSWALGAEVRSADGKMGAALVSFDVVEPFSVALRLPEKPVPTSVKDVTLGVVIRNNMRHEVRGQAAITLPAGWELWKNDNKRDFRAPGEGLTTVEFKAKPPLGALTEVPVKVDVTINGKTVSADGKFSLITEAPAAK